MKKIVKILLSLFLCFSYAVGSVVPSYAIVGVAGGVALWEIIAAVLGIVGISYYSFDSIQDLENKYINRTFGNGSFDPNNPTSQQSALLSAIMTAFDRNYRIVDDKPSSGTFDGHPILHDIVTADHRHLIIFSLMTTAEAALYFQSRSEGYDSDDYSSDTVNSCGLTPEEFSALARGGLSTMFESGKLALSEDSPLSGLTYNLANFDFNSSDYAEFGYSDFNDVENVPIDSLLCRVWYDNGMILSYYNKGHRVNNGFYYAVDGTGYFGGMYSGEWRSYSNYSGNYNDWSMPFSFTVNEYSRKGFLNIGNQLVGYLPGYSDNEYNFPVIRGILLGGQLFDFSDLVHSGTTSLTSEDENVDVAPENVLTVSGVSDPAQLTDDDILNYLARLGLVLPEDKENGQIVINTPVPDEQDQERKRLVYPPSLLSGILPGYKKILDAGASTVTLPITDEGVTFGQGFFNSLLRSFQTLLQWAFIPSVPLEDRITEFTSSVTNNDVYLRNLQYDELQIPDIYLTLYDKELKVVDNRPIRQNIVGLRPILQAICTLLYLLHLAMFYKIVFGTIHSSGVDKL